MKDCIYQSYRLEWRELEIEVRYCPDWLGSNEKYATAHIEVESVCRSPLPITETGYVSHFTIAELVEAEGGPVSFVEAWLNALAGKKAWKDTEVRRRQYSLF